MPLLPDPSGPGRVAAALAGAIVPPLCVACRGGAAPGATLCAGCEMRLGTAESLTGGPPPGVDRVWSAAHHHGVPRRLVTALKHGRLLAAADRMAAEIADRAPRQLLAGPLVPVPSSPGRTRRRGLSPAGEIATALAGRSNAGVLASLERRGGERQVGRSRGARRAGMLELRVAGPAPRSCTLVDDVITTGGTLTACAIALRAAGTEHVTALSFTRRL